MVRTNYKTSFFLRKNVVNKNGESGIFLRLTVNKEAAQISTKATCAVGDWDTDAGKMRGKTKKANQLNDFLAEIRAAILFHIQEMERRDEIVTLEKVKNAYLGITARAETLMEIFKKWLENAEKLVDVSKSRETYRKYERGYRRLQEFMKETYNITDIALRELSYEFIVDYESYLRRVSKFGVNTTAKFIQTLRMIVLYAKNNGMIFKDPFLNYKVKKEEVDRGYLTTDELDRIASKVIPVPRLDHVRDMFLFACFTGLAYIDVANLMESDIKEAFDGSKWIMTHRQKTGVAVNVPLLDYPLAIIEKYKGQCPDGHVLPIISNQRTNSYLKELATVCGIDKNITFHLARHTFATTVTLANGMPIETVSKMLGHTNIKTTQIYARITNEKIRTDMQRLASALPEIGNMTAEEINEATKKANPNKSQPSHPDLL